jgi:hypothetical protein
MHAIKLKVQERHLNTETEIISIIYLSTCLFNNPTATYEAQAKKRKKNKPTYITKGKTKTCII